MTTTIAASRLAALLEPYASDGPAYRDEMARTMEQERELLRKLNLLPA